MVIKAAVIKAIQARLLWSLTAITNIANATIQTTISINSPIPMLPTVVITEIIIKC